MKIKELKEILSTYPDDMAVLVDGYEGGLQNVSPNAIFKTKIKLNALDGWRYGEPHEEDENGDTEAVII